LFEHFVWRVTWDWDVDNCFNTGR